MIILWLKSRWPPLTEEKQGLHFMAFPLTCSSLSSALLFALSQTSQILSNEALSSLRCKFRAQPKWNKWLLLYKVTSPSWVTHSHITEKMSRFIERQWLFGSFCHWLAPTPFPIWEEASQNFQELLLLQRRRPPLPCASWEMSEVSRGATLPRRLWVSG